jgi:ATP-binding cassette subfamily C protein LapB
MMTPSRGTVRLDGIEVRQLALDWRRTNIGYLPQEPAFFDGTLRDNLALDREVTDDDLLLLIREMGLEQFLANDPLGLDRVISSHDTGLPVGLRRRLALVRAVLGSARVIVLDEPTEGLDQPGQLVVANLLNRLVKEGRSLIVASNEPFIMRSADLLVDLGKKPVPMVGMPRPSSTADPTGSAHGATGVTLIGGDR